MGRAEESPMLRDYSQELPESGHVPFLAYETDLGRMIMGNAEGALRSPILNASMHKVQLILTSPPFPLNRKKKYGNLQGDDYLNWLASFAPLFREYLAPDGSVVMEIGNAWKAGSPVMSTLALRALLAFLDQGEFHLCQQFVCFNPARLPGPAQWVNVERIRVKDAYTHVWWMSPSERPKADNRRVLKPYSMHMEQLLKSKTYNAGKRPSEHVIGTESFLRDNGGAIPPNVLSMTNTRATDKYQRYCRKNGFRTHPARMPMALPEFFINFLTDPGDIIMDPFAGSNTTGHVAESLKRRWVSIEPERAYILSSLGWFVPEAE